MDVHAFFQAVLSKDRNGLQRYFWEDAVVNWHCSNERFTAAEYIRANCDYPGEWTGVIERAVQTGDGFVLAAHVMPVGAEGSYHVVSFIRLRDGRIACLDEYWADDTEPPEWRKKMKIGCPISNHRMIG